MSTSPSRRLAATTGAPADRPAEPPGDTDRLDRPLLKLAAILLVGGIAPFLDSTIVNVAIGTLGHGLHAGVATVQWVNTGYLLALGVVVPLAAWACDCFGARRVWLAALVLFLAGSVLSGLAWNIESLVAFRVVQGVGGGLLLPTLQTLLIRAAGPRRVGRMLSVVTVVAVVVPIAGPVIGGAIVSELSWRWIFYVNVPLCLIGLVAAWRGLPPGPARPGARVDLLGLALLAPALAAIIDGLANAGSRHGLLAPGVLIPVGLGLVLLVAFTAHALRAGPAALVDLRLFRVRSFAASASLLFLAGLSLYGALLLLPLYYQDVRGRGALAAGMLLVPQGLGTLLTRWVGPYIDRVGARPIVLAGTAVAALGTLAFTQAGAHTGYLVLSLALVVRGAGLGAATIAMVAGAYQGIPPESVAQASGATRIMQQIGGSFGTAVLAVILQHGLSAHPVAAFHHAFWWAFGFTLLLAPPALLLPGSRLAVPRRQRS